MSQENVESLRALLEPLDVEAWRRGAADVFNGAGPAFVWLKVVGEHGKKTPSAPRPMAEQIRRLQSAIVG